MGVQKIEKCDFRQRAGSGREWCYMVLEVPGAAFRGLKRAFSVSTGVFVFGRLSEAGEAGSCLGGKGWYRAEKPLKYLISAKVVQMT